MTTDAVNIVINDIGALKALINGDLAADIFGAGGAKSGGSNLRKKSVPVTAADFSQYFHNTGGLFVDCELQAPVMNATIQPTRTLANLIPVQATRENKVAYSYLTDIDDGGDTPQDEVCDNPPTVGDVAKAKAEFDLGRLSFQSKTMELSDLIELASRCAYDDFYFIGDERGVSAIPGPDFFESRDLIMTGAVRRQMQFIMRRFQKKLSQWLWTGDPTDVAQNGTGGGWTSFWGLLDMIADDYGAKSYVSGTNLTALNSDVKDFSTAPNQGLVGSDNLYEYMQEMEDTLYNRAELMGLVPYTARWVMHPTMWSQIVKYLPCDMISDGCSNGVVNANDGGAGMFNLAMRNQMNNTMTIDVNGRTYEVVTDHAIPLTYNTTTKQYTSSIFYVPFNVAGENVLYWRHLNYSLLESALAPLPGTLEARGWSDGGRFHWIVEHIRRCFVVDGVIKPGLVFRAPHLAGRIDNVTVQVIQRKPEAFPVTETA